MSRRIERGTSLIEVLTVIVVFLVGILALMQAFPSGLALLRATRSNTLASSLARAEMQRLQTASEALPDMIVPGFFLGGGTVFEINPAHPWNGLMPTADSGTGGELNMDGDVIVGGSSIGKWDKVSGANHYNRVIGEGGVVPAPRPIGALTGGLMHLQFSPVYYSRSVATGVGQPGILTAYANDLIRRWGNPEFNRPNPGRRGRDSVFFVVDSEADSPLFPGEDQVWVPIQQDTAGNPYLTGLRLSFTFTYQANTNFSQHDVVINIDPATVPATVMTSNGLWQVINLRELIAQPGEYSSTGFDAASFIAADLGSVRVQRAYSELPLSQPFQDGNPYQFKVLNDEVGSLLFNPSASRVKTESIVGGDLVPLQARVDYTVLDWRIIKDGFRVPPASGNSVVRLQLQGLKASSSDAADGRQFGGLGFLFPNGNNTVSGSDFAVLDEETGGIILGNTPGGIYNSYFVEKRGGSITFVDQDPAAGIQAYLTVIQPDGAWSAPQLVTVDGRAVKTYYMVQGEWAVQTHKSARSYRIAPGVGPSGLSAGEVFVGQTQLADGTLFGDENILYFPLSDLGHRVVISELRAQGPGGFSVVRDQEFHINTTRPLGGVLHAAINVAPKIPGSTLSWQQVGYPVKGVRGASVRVRVLYNPERFSLLPDARDNFNQLERWMRDTRTIEAEGFLASGARK